jgi:hypothetical protein
MRWWLLLGLWACDDGGRNAVPDRGLVLDLGRMDAARDQGREDSAPSADAAPRDTAVDQTVAPDGATLDASRDVSVPDSAVDAGPMGCVGIVLPPPPVSPDGSEVCNYRDDDGDGLVDEGFAYDFLGEPVRITEEPQNVPGDLRIAASPDGYGAAWNTAFGARFVKLAQNGCPTTPLQVVDQNPEGQAILPSSVTLAFSSGRFALTFTQLRLLGGPDVGVWGTFVQLFEQDGTPVGQPIDIDPRLSHLGFNAIEPYQDGFAVFSAAYHPERGGLNYSSFVILDRDGRIVLGPSHPYDQPGLGQAMRTFIGMDFDGEGFGMAWFGAGNWFMRWSPEGEVLTQPVYAGFLGQGTDITWTGTHHVIPSRNMAYKAELRFLGVDGDEAEWSPLILGTDDGQSAIGVAAWWSDQLIVAGFIEFPFMGRYSRRGDARLGPELDLRRRFPEAWAWDAPTVGVLLLQSDPVAGTGIPTFGAIGCKEE